MAELRSPITAPPGGVMTDEVGVVTGALELRTRCADDGALVVDVAYQGALDWYVVTGTAAVRLADVADHEQVHRLLAGVLDRPDG